MALTLFKILTIFGNLQRAVNHSLKWLEKACSARLYDTIKTAFIKKVWSPVGLQQNNCRNICNGDKQSIDADFLCPKVDLLQLQIS